MNVACNDKLGEEVEVVDLVICRICLQGQR